MPVVRVSVRAGVLAHRRNKYAVRKGNIPNRERIKQMSHRAYTAFLNSEEAPNLWPVVSQRVARVFARIYSMHGIYASEYACDSHIFDAWCSVKIQQLRKATTHAQPNQKPEAHPRT